MPAEENALYACGTCVRDLQGFLRHQFQRALERGSMIDAVSAAKAMGSLTLGDALALCVVFAHRDRARYHRAAVR
jgi:hypothetical protein